MKITARAHGADFQRPDDDAAERPHLLAHACLNFFGIVNFAGFDEAQFAHDRPHRKQNFGSPISRSITVRGAANDGAERQRGLRAPLR